MEAFSEIDKTQLGPQETEEQAGKEAKNPDSEVFQTENVSSPAKVEINAEPNETSITDENPDHNNSPNKFISIPQEGELQAQIITPNETKDIPSAKKITSNHYTLSNSPIVTQSIDRKSDIFSDSQKKSIDITEGGQTMTKPFDEHHQEEEINRVLPVETDPKEVPVIVVDKEEGEKSEMKIEQMPNSEEKISENNDCEIKAGFTEGQNIEAEAKGTNENEPQPKGTDSNEPPADQPLEEKITLQSTNKKSSNKRALSPEKSETSSSKIIKSFSSKKNESEKVDPARAKNLESVKKAAQESLDKIISSTSGKSQQKENMGSMNSSNNVNKASHYKICPQCQGDLENTKMKVKTLACTHKFHEDCLSKMNQKACPTCTNSFAATPSEKMLTKKTPVKN